MLDLPMSLRDEILEQPAAASRLINASSGDLTSLSAAIARRRPAFVVIAARGSSDNAGLYGQYLFAVRNGLTVALAAPSTITLLGAKPVMADALVIGISQSGRSPDIVAVIAEARQQGALTVALTNDPSSPLATAAAELVDLRAGPELATAATKTYTTELIAMALVSGAIDALRPDELRGLSGLPDLMTQALDSEQNAREIADEHRPGERAVILGRGYEYATAREWALKLQELAQLPVIPFSAADFEHGPIALIDDGYTVYAVVPRGELHAAQLDLLQRLRAKLGARVIVISDMPEARKIDLGLSMPGDVPAWLAPVVEIIPAQWYAYYLTLARGLDPERPRALSKVTETT